MDTDCVLTHGTWYCAHDCDDPSHGHQGPHRIYADGHYYRPGDLIPATQEDNPL